MKIIKKLVLSIVIVFLTSVSLSGCKSKKVVEAPTATPAAVVFELKDEEMPYISLTPRADGRELKLKISNIPDFVSDMEYELLYTASDNGLEVEKGVGDSLKIESTSIERDILLGTSSCTTTCKYKYDDGVTGGNVTLTLITKDGSAATVTTDFIITTTSEIKKAGGITYKADDFKLPLSGSITGTDYYIMLKNNKQYSVFSSGNKNSLIGDHQSEN